MIELKEKYAPVDCALKKLWTNACAEIWRRARQREVCDYDNPVIDLKRSMTAPLSLKFAWRARPQAGEHIASTLQTGANERRFFMTR
jgi:hypothetical protein